MWANCLRNCCNEGGDDDLLVTRSKTDNSLTVLGVGTHSSTPVSRVDLQPTLLESHSPSSAFMSASSAVLQKSKSTFSASLVEKKLSEQSGLVEKKLSEQSGPVDQPVKGQRSLSGQAFHEATVRQTTLRKAFTKAYTMQNLSVVGSSCVGSSYCPEDATWCLNIIGQLCVDDNEMHPFIRFSDFKPLWTESCTVMSVVCRGVRESDLYDPDFGSPGNPKKAAVAQALEVLKARIKAWPGAKIIGLTGDMHGWRYIHEALVQELAGDLLFPKGDAKLLLTNTSLLPLAFAAWGNAKVLCLTEASVEQFWEMCCPLPEDQRQQLIVRSLQGVPDLDTLRTHEPSEEFDEAFAELVEEIIREEQDDETGDGIQLILTSGMNLSLLSDALRDVFEKPVFDAMSWVQFLAMGCTQSEFNHDTRKKKKKESIGVVRLDYHYPPAVGDAAHEDTFRFQIHFRQANNLTFQAAQQASFTDDIIENFTKAVQELEDIGVVGISGDCGFMMHYQSLARVCTKRTPVFMSALILAGTLSLWCGRDQRVLILTANSESFSSAKEQLLQGHCIRTDPDRFLIKDPRSVRGFEAVDRAEKVDVPLVSQGIGKFVKTLLKRDMRANPNRPIGFILLECTELPPYADIIRGASGLPTYDVTSLIDFFHRCTSEASWNGTGYPPHNAKFWRKALGADGKLKAEWLQKNIPK